MRRLRPFTWVILVINLLFAIWLIAGIVTTNRDGAECGPGGWNWLCEGTTATGGLLEIVLILIIWGAVDLILLVLWLVTRPRQPQVTVQVAPGYPAYSNEMTTSWETSRWDDAGLVSSEPLARPRPPAPKVKVWAITAVMAVLVSLAFAGGVWLGREQGRDQIRTQLDVSSN